MKHIKTFESFLNEAKTSDIAMKLMDIAERGWEKFGFNSADDVYDNLDKQKQYADMLDAEIRKANLAQSIYQNAEKVHDQLEDDNFHHLNAYLALAGYYTPNYQKSYSNYIKNSKSSSWSPDLFESSMNERKSESGLMVFGRTPMDNTEIGKWLDKSDYHAEWNAREGYWLFPEDEDGYDELESELDKAFNKAGINARFEGIF